MTTETIQAFSNEERTEAAVRALAEQTINAALEKHGAQRSDLTQVQIDEAYGYARQRVTDQAALEKNEYYRLWQAEKEKHEATKLQLGVVKSNRSNQSQENRADVTVERARGLMGTDWHLATDAVKLRAIGVDPSKVNREQLWTLFGVGADTHTVVDFQRSAPKTYATLREAAIALNIYGARRK